MAAPITNRPNTWKASNNLLPRLTSFLSMRCSGITGDPGESVAARLTKRNRWCKASTAFLLLPLAVAAASAPNPRPTTNALRDCIASASGPAAIGACEKRQQAVLKRSIEQLSAEIRARLDTPQRLVFDRNVNAWQTFFQQEIALLDLSLGIRGDGLGPSLRTGSITLLFEQREQQLREHLHNLTAAKQAAPAAGD